VNRATTPICQSGRCSREAPTYLHKVRAAGRCASNPPQILGTNSALVKAANDMVIAKMPTQMPLCKAPSAPESTLATLAAGSGEPRKAGGGVRTG